jgi:multidrug efflux pump subunit AcrA (membrane-fusion protein)
LLLCLGALALGVGAAYGLARANASTSLGYLETESAVVSAGVAGKIEEMAAAEGARVEPGQKILVVVDELLESQISALRRRVDVLHSEVNQARAQADVDLRWRMKELESEILDIRLKSAGFLQSRYDQEIEQFAWTDLLKESLIDPVEFFADAAPDHHHLYPQIQPVSLPRESRMKAAIRKEAASNALEVSQAQIEMCEARLKELETLKHDLPQQIARSHGVEVAEARLAEATEELSRLESRPRNIELKSPIHGTVGIFRKAKGDRVGAGESIVTILDEDQRFLTLLIPSRQAPQYPAGGRVLLDFPGGETRIGQIRTVPPQAVTTVGDTTAAPAAQDSLISLRIDPVEKLWPAAPVGTAVQVRPAN